VTFSQGLVREFLISYLSLSAVLASNSSALSRGRCLRLRMGVRVWVAWWRIGKRQAVCIGLHWLRGSICWRRICIAGVIGILWNVSIWSWRYSEGTGEAYSILWRRWVGAVVLTCPLLRWWIVLWWRVLTLTCCIRWWVAGRAPLVSGW
jgi:hypothetical protein